MVPEQILDIIKENYDYVETTKDIRIRCPFCGDSKKHPNSKHLYISKVPVPPYNTFVYHCFRAECGARGTLLEFCINQNLIQKLSKETISVLLETTRNNSFFKKYNYDVSVKVKNHIPKIITKRKLEYVKQRLGISNLPIFIRKFLFDNFSFLPKDIVSEKLKKILTKKFIGFKTCNSRKIICRNIFDEDWRYYNIKLLDYPDYFITSPILNDLDILKNGTIIMAEGIFSVLRGYFVLKDLKLLKEKNCILLATLGGNSYTFVSAYKYAVSTFGIPDWNVIVLSDPDVKYQRYYPLRNITNGPIKVFYNKFGDFGEVKHEIYSLII